jgi:hypothetical protein
MAPSRLIGRALTQWHITAPQPARSISFVIQTNAPIFCTQNSLDTHRRFRSDFLKHRAVEALKKRNAAEAASPSATGVVKEEKDVAASSSANYTNANDFGDDHQLAGLAAAAKSSDNSFSASAKKLESSQNNTVAPSRSMNDETTTTTTSSAEPVHASTSVSNQTIQEVTNSAPQSIESSPWAHMQLHEFAPKIVVVGVGGAGTNAVNNMVASGLSGESALCPPLCIMLFFFVFIQLCVNILSVNGFRSRIPRTQHRCTTPIHITIAQSSPNWDRINLWPWMRCQPRRWSTCRRRKQRSNRELYRRCSHGLYYGWNGRRDRNRCRSRCGRTVL